MGNPNTKNTLLIKFGPIYLDSKSMFANVPSKKDLCYHSLISSVLSNIVLEFWKGGYRTRWYGMKEYEKDRVMCLVHAPKFSKTTYRYKEWKSTCWKYWWNAGKISKMFVNKGNHSKMFNIFCGNGIETVMDILHVQKDRELPDYHMHWARDTQIPDPRKWSPLFRDLWLMITYCATNNKC